MINVLLAGYGLAGRSFHAPLINAVQGMRIRGVVTDDPGRRSQARKELPDARIFPHADQALAELDDVDLVVVANANRAHVATALAAIARGRHVVIDKPVAGSAHDAQRIADAARAAGVQIHPFQNRRWDSEFLTLRAIAASGELGRVHRLDSRIERYRALPRGTWRDSSDPDDLGGVLLDFGAHLVDQAIELLGPVEAVTAHARATRHAGAGNDDMQIALEHTGGALSCLVGSQAAAFSGPRFMLLGTRGGVRIDGCDTQEAALRSGRQPGGPDWGHEEFRASVRVADARHELAEEQRSLLPGRWDAIYPAIRDSIAGTAAAPVPFSDAIANLDVLDAARESVANGGRISLTAPAAHG